MPDLKVPKWISGTRALISVGLGFGLIVETFIYSIIRSDSYDSARLPEPIEQWMNKSPDALLVEKLVGMLPPGTYLSHRFLFEIVMWSTILISLIWWGLILYTIITAVLWTRYGMRKVYSKI